MFIICQTPAQPEFVPSSFVPLASTRVHPHAHECVLSLHESIAMSNTVFTRTRGCQTEHIMTWWSRTVTSGLLPFFVREGERDRTKEREHCPS